MLNIVFGSTGVLGRQIVLTLKDSNEVVIEINRRKSNSGQISIDLADQISHDFFQELKNLLNDVDEVTIYFAAVANDLQYQSDISIHRVNFINPKLIADFLEEYCILKNITLKLVFFLSSVDIYPSSKIPNYSASKAALKNYILGKLSLVHIGINYYGIYTGPFKSPMWDPIRMQKYENILKVIRYPVEPKDKIKRIMGIISKNHNTIKYDLSHYFHLAIMFKQVIKIKIGTQWK